MILIELPNGKILFAAFNYTYYFLGYFGFFSPSIQLIVFLWQVFVSTLKIVYQLIAEKIIVTWAFLGEISSTILYMISVPFLNKYMIEIFLDLITSTLYANQLLWLQLIYINILYTNENIDSYSLIRN